MNMTNKFTELKAQTGEVRPKMRAALLGQKDNEEDPVFLAAVVCIFCELDREHNPREARLVKIKNWFDHKWLRFAGKGLIECDFGGPREPGVCVDEHFSERSFPPFTPNRVLDEGAFRCTKPGFVVHSRKHRRSSWNLQRRATELFESGVFLWYSSRSSSNRRGSLLVLVVGRGKVVQRWYASFLGEGHWQLGLVKGYPRAKVVEYLRDWPRREKFNA
jgi:hypothetical protein